MGTTIGKTSVNRQRADSTGKSTATLVLSEMKRLGWIMRLKKINFFHDHIGYLANSKIFYSLTISDWREVEQAIIGHRKYTQSLQ